MNLSRLDVPKPHDHNLVPIQRQVFGMAVVACIERRRSARYQFRESVVLKIAGREIKAESRNLSDAGMFVVSPVPVEPLSEVDARFELCMDAMVRCEVEVRAAGCVVRVEPADGDKYGIALKLRAVRLMVGT